MDVGSRETWRDGTEAYRPDDKSLILDFGSIRLMLTGTDTGIFAGIVRMDETNAVNGQGMATLSEVEASWLAVQLMGAYYPDLHEICQQVVEVQRQVVEEGRSVNGISVVPVSPRSEPATGFYL